MEEKYYLLRVPSEMADAAEKLFASFYLSFMFRRFNATEWVSAPFDPSKKTEATSREVAVEELELALSGCGISGYSVTLV